MRSPLVVLMLVAIILGGATLWIVGAAHQAASKRFERDMLQECVSESGHERVPCPKELDNE